jgi:hypothetical protein
MANVVNKADALSVFGTTVYASAARTATPDTQEYRIGGDVDEFVVVVDVTNVTATGTLVVKVQGVDAASGKAFDLNPAATTASISANGTYTISVGGSLPAVATNPAVSVNAVVPPVLRITATHGNGVSLTYSVGLLLS